MRAVASDYRGGKYSNGKTKAVVFTFRKEITVKDFTKSLHCVLFYITFFLLVNYGYPLL